MKKFLLEILLPQIIAWITKRFGPGAAANFSHEAMALLETEPAGPETITLLDEPTVMSAVRWLFAKLKPRIEDRYGWMAAVGLDLIESYVLSIIPKILEKLAPAPVPEPVPERMPKRMP